MGKVHLGSGDLSAFADGELEPGEAREARAHLDACGRCSAELASLTRLDHALAATPLIDCAGSLDLRSSLLDGQLAAAEAAIARQHIEDCRDCAADEVAWLASGLALRMLPAALPAARVDAAIRALTEKGARRPVLPGSSGLVPGVGLRVGIAAALVLAIVVGLLPTGSSEQAQAPAPQEALVSSVQQVVLYSPTNTFYVLQPQQAAVNAVDAATYAVRARIALGGEPTALALDSLASRILVLDAGRKSLIEIDPASNAVVKSTPVEITGTPTSLRVDSNGKVLVTATRDPGRGGGAGGPRPTPDGSSGGQVAVLDTERKLEVVRSVEVAPRQVITDPQGKGALFVSTSATTLVDSSYQPQRSLPGGVGAAYGVSGWIAVLGRSGTDAVLHLFGDGAPQPLRLMGIPLAVTSMPEGGFAVLLGSGSGNGRIVVIDEAGAAVGTTPVDQVGRDLMYDPKAKRFGILSGGNVVAAALPAGLGGVARQPEQSAAPSASIEPGPRLAISPEPSATAAPEGSALPSASPSIAPSPRPGPTGAPPAGVASAPTLPPGVPAGAILVRPDLYRFELPAGRVPVLTTATATRIWFLDSKNGLNSLDLASGATFRVAQLPDDARITTMAAGATHVYAPDSNNGRLFAFQIADEHLTWRDVPFLRGNVAMLVAPDGVLWFGIEDSAQIVRLEPRSGRIELVDSGMSGVVALTIDNFARLWFSDGQRSLASYDLRTGLLTHVRVPGRGAARALLPNPAGSIWVGTSEGEVISVREDVATVATSTGRPITRLVLDPHGLAWYLTPAPAGTAGLVYGPVDGTRAPRPVPGPALSLDFSLSWGAWMADASGAFYLGVESPR